MIYKAKHNYEHKKRGNVFAIRLIIVNLGRGVRILAFGPTYFFPRITQTLIDLEYQRKKYEICGK